MTNKVTPISQMKPKHSKTKMTKDQFNEFLSSEIDNFDEWRNMVQETIKVQRSNVRRADMYSSILFQIANNDLARMIAHADKDGSLLWAVNLARRVASHIENILDELESVFGDFTYNELIKGGVRAAEEPLFKMVPFFNDKVTAEEIYWGDITYQTIRPYGEKLNDAVRGAYQRFNSVKDQLDEEALEVWNELDGEDE